MVPPSSNATTSNATTLASNPANGTSSSSNATTLASNPANGTSSSSNATTLASNPANGTSSSSNATTLASNPANGTSNLILESNVLNNINNTTSNNSMTTTTNNTATIETTQGPIKIEFFPDVAPNHVKNFQDLASKGFYDGVVFHRIVPGFVIQAGDPNTKNGNSSRDTWGTGGPGYTINQEFNSIPHERGILSMARTNDPNSAGSQFFIVLNDSKFLDNQYTVFGKVTEGLEIVDKIANSTTNAMDQPEDPNSARINKIILQ